MDNSFLHTKRLLLVDDEQELLKMVSDILKDAGFETVLTAMTVKEAILTAKEETPDLIVLDVMLPDGDGFSLMQHFRTFTNVPIIFLTAKDEAADKLSGLGLGVQMTTFLSPLCRRNCYCVSMRYCGEPTKRIHRCLFWMDVRLISAGPKSIRAAKLSP